MKILCVFIKYNYGSVARGLSIECMSFLPAFESLGHEVRHFDTWDPAQFPTYADMNRGLLHVVEEWRPDVIFTVQRDFEIWIETLQLLADRGDTALVTWTTDDSFKFDRYSRFIAPYYDATSTTYDYRLEDYRKAGIDGVIYTQWAANDAWLQTPKPADECTYQVSFVGTKYGEREALTSALRHAGVEMTCFGYGWPNGPVEASSIPEIMRDSVVCLNFSGGFQSVDGNDKQLKARTFEVPGAGGFLLTDRAPSIEKFYSIGKEIEVFDSADDLVRKVKFYLAHSELRDRIANAGFERTRNEHLYPIRLRTILDFALQRRDLRTQRGSGRTPGDTSNVAALADRPLTVFERIYRLALTKACQLVWGKERGLKAARRLTFEASVRLLGARTFTSKSLPARLFPYV